MRDPDTADASSGPLARTVFVTIPEIVTGILFLVAVLINFANVVGRYLLAHAIPWAEEVLVLLMLWMVFLAAGTVAFRGAHLNMDLFSAHFPPPVRRAVNLVVAALLVGCCGFVAWQSFGVVRLHYVLGAHSPSSPLPLFLPALAVAVGFLLSAVAVLVRFRCYVTGDFGAPATRSAEEIPAV